jgi:hypothetical protein
MKETSCQFGHRRQLTGIITEPSAAHRRVALVLISAGLVPTFGPYRLYTKLARRLAREGFLTMRFDLGGIGDSQQAYANLPLKSRTELEIRSALDYLTTHHELDGIVLGGLCSGAEDAFRYAELDPRVTGVVLIDPFSYRTPGWKWRHLLHRLTRRSLRALGLHKPLASSGAAGSPSDQPLLLTYKYMDHEESSRILYNLIQRGARAHFVYTGGARDSFNHKGQLKEMYQQIDFKGLVTLDHFPHFEHTQVFEGDRHQMVEAICERLVRACRPMASSVPLQPPAPARGPLQRVIGRAAAAFMA